MQYVDRELTKLMSMMEYDGPPSPFHQYAEDVTPKQCAVIKKKILSVRAAMQRILELKGIDIRPVRPSKKHEMTTILSFLDISVEELRAKYMKGYGALTNEAAQELDDIADELQEVLKSMKKSLTDV